MYIFWVLSTKYTHHHANYVPTKSTPIQKMYIIMNILYQKPKKMSFGCPNKK